MTSQCQSYSLLAEEYYDAVRHPTCANFRHASALILRKYLPRLLRVGSRVCEVGAGRSLVAEIYRSIGRMEALSSLVITDASDEMLSHSLVWQKYGTRVRQAPAAALPYQDGYFDLVVAVSCDPYNERSTWLEVERVLAHDGHCVFTVPSYQWAVKYRGLTNSDAGAAEFDLRNGARVAVPSFIFPADIQMDQMREVGLYTSSYDTIRLSDISDQHISPKLLIDDDNLAIVEGYLLSKHKRTS